MKNQLISKENLKKIHDVACSGWKSKLIEYANRNPFGSEVELSSEEVNEMFNASGESQIKILNKFLKRDIGVINGITSYETACDSLGIRTRINVTPYEKLTTIIKALNQGWYPNIGNREERKFFNYFHMDNGVFSFDIVGYNDTYMSVPSALYLKDETTAKYAKERFFNEYKALYLE